MGSSRRAKRRRRQHLATREQPLTPEERGQLRKVASGLAVSHSTTTAFSGPIPPPSILKEYDEVVPGAAARILEMAEAQGRHRIDLESRVVKSDIWKSYFGLVFAFVVSISFLACGTWLVYTDHDWAGATIATASLVGLAGTFIYGTRARRAERAEKLEEVRRRK